MGDLLRHFLSHPCPLLHIEREKKMRLRTRYTQRLPVTIGLRLDIPMFEGSGTKVLNLSGKGNHGTITDAVWTRDENGVAMSFNGTSAYIDCGNDASLNITDAITIEAWVKRNGDSGEYDGIIAKNAKINGYLLRVSNNRVKFFLRHPDASPTHKMIQANDLLSDGIWTHCVAVRDDNNDMWLYINGILQTDTANFPYSWDTSAANLSIGEYSGTFFKGAIDEVRIYAVALTAEQIKRRYEQTKRDYVRAH